MKNLKLSGANGAIELPLEIYELNNNNNSIFLKYIPIEA